MANFFPLHAPVILPTLIAAALFAACDRPSVVPGPGATPDRVILTLTDDPARSQAVVWRTDASVKAGQAQIALALGEPDLSAAAQTLDAATENLRLRDSDWNRKGSEHVSYHSVTFRNLEPGTAYAYRVGLGEHWSEWHHFRTAQEDPAASFEFLYFGDAQNGVLSHWSRALRTAYRMSPNAAFAIYAGDLVNDGHADDQWSEWHRAGGWLHATLPAVPVTGNHEYRALDRARTGTQLLSMHWRPQFSLPETAGVPDELAETVYRVDVQAASFFVLNSNRDVETQALWLDEALASANLEAPQKWKIVTFHHPLFSNASGRDNPELRALWLPILVKHGVDLVLQGHDHTYSRGALAETSSASGEFSDVSPGGDTVGPVFVSSVSGAKQYELSEPVWGGYEGEAKLLRAGENMQLFQIVQVDAERISYRSYTAAGDLYDGFERLRDSEGNERIVELETPTEERRFSNTTTYRSGHWQSVPE